MKNSNAIINEIKQACKIATPQSGRSMVEMLSVLSVIGVLSIAAVFGYNVLMEKHKNNQRLSETTMRAVVASSQMLQGRTPDLHGIFPDEAVGHAMAVTAVPNEYAYVDENGDEVDFSEVVPNPDAKEFALELTNVPLDVLKYFLDLVYSGGIIQRIMDSDGKEITKDNVGNLSTTTTNIKIYLVYKSDMAQSQGKEAREAIGDSSQAVCNNHGQFVNVVNSDGTSDSWGCKCEDGYSGRNCSEEGGACSGNGYWFSTELTQKCICNEGYTGTYCGELLGFSPCQTLEKKDGKEIRGFKAYGTDCTQAGIEGKCNSYGRCVPKGGRSCNGSADCGDGQFCNYGGNFGGNYTPDVCEQVTAKEFDYQGKIYYYNTDEDLRSWCRSADRQKNCTWGFLSYQGAQSWCESLGAKLVDADTIKANCSEFKKHLPQVADDQQYWATGLSVVHLGNDCQIQKMSRGDGYAWAGGVVCEKTTVVTPALTDEDQAFLSEMEQVSQMLKDFNPTLSEYSGDYLELAQTLSELKTFADGFVSFSSQFTENGNEVAVERFRTLKQDYDTKNFENKIDTLNARLSGDDVSTGVDTTKTGDNNVNIGGDTGVTQTNHDDQSITSTDSVSVTYVHGGKTTKLLRSLDSLEWSEANNWCKEHGMKLVKASSLGCATRISREACSSDVYDDMISAGLPTTGNSFESYFWTLDTYSSGWSWAFNLRAKVIGPYASGNHFHALCE